MDCHAQLKKHIMIKYPHYLPSTHTFPDGRVVTNLQYADDETIIECGYEYVLKDQPPKPTQPGNWVCQPTNDKTDWEWNLVEMPQTIIDVTTFRKRFTDAELLAALTSTDNNVKMLMFKLTTTMQIDLADTAVIAGVNYLQSVGILTAERAEGILA